ncbi:LysR family transcriptional regulator [Pseudoduganella namucuonensis]|uniref:DNA-binding transcriptional regulator, LysR family n=1 Tax=Pseudoduganella namucuonensis TaxID=1035707 RepID=A0A1I7K8G8_9BURK|nr:LysR family transcriptional regulator [Pseudoduganella namucuonensis]SFU93734.1 DNA-binding transcriptional regulator, LysR family [Pseudoduganella namucuonensis]
MEIYQLRTFLTVARQGHLTRAAEQLHISQSAVSKQIKALEEELGVILFARGASGTSLTRSGQLLLAQAEKTLDSALELVNMANKIRGEITGTVKLGTIIDPECLRLGAVLGRLLARHPQIDVKLAQGISGSVLERIRAGTVDAGFYLGALDDASVQATELCVLTYLVVAPKEWEERVSGAGWDRIARLPWIGTPVHSSQHRLVSEMFAEQGYELSSVIEVDQEASMRSLVAMGVGLCLLREDIAHEAVRNGQMVVWTGAKRGCPLSFIHLKSRAGDALVGALRQAVLEVWLP